MKRTNKKCITQRELRSVIQAANALDRTLYRMRRRIDSGAEIEAGAYAVTLEPFEGGPFRPASSHGDGYSGVNIDRASTGRAQRV